MQQCSAVLDLHSSNTLIGQPRAGRGHWHRRWGGGGLAWRIHKRVSLRASQARMNRLEPSQSICTLIVCPDATCTRGRPKSLGTHEWLPPPPPCASTCKIRKTTVGQGHACTQPAFAGKRRLASSKSLNFRQLRKMVFSWRSATHHQKLATQSNRERGHNSGRHMFTSGPNVCHSRPVSSPQPHSPTHRRGHEKWEKRGKR